MSRLIWSLPALQDVQRLHRLLSGKMLMLPGKPVKAIRESIKVLAHQPGIGRPAEDMEPEVSRVDHRFRGQRLYGPLPL